MPQPARRSQGVEHMNMDRCRFQSIVLAGALLALAGCSGGEPAEPAGGGSVDAVAETREARILPIPGVNGPAGEGSSGELRWDVPDDWIVEPPTSGMRFAQYRVPGPAGDGECVVFYFGPGQGGDPMANAVRWAGMFTQPDGSSSVDRMQIDNVDSRGGPVRIVEAVSYTHLRAHET